MSGVRWISQLAADRVLLVALLYRRCIDTFQVAVCMRMNVVDAGRRASLVSDAVSPGLLSRCGTAPSGAARTPDWNGTTLRV